MKKIDFRENINCIKESGEGRYRIILDFATTNILPFLISDHYKYVWVHNHVTGKQYEWKQFNLPIKNSQTYTTVLARRVNFEFVLPTEEFKKIMTDWKGGIELIQMNNLPPHYMDLNKVKGNKRYEILEKECDYLFEVDIPSATDYGTLISPKRDYLQSLLDNPEINWNHLP
jgi:hypothetical protein